MQKRGPRVFLKKVIGVVAKLARNPSLIMFRICY